MKNKLRFLAVALIAGGTMFAQTRFSVGVGINTGGYAPGYYPPPVYAQQYAPPCPGPGYTWVDGYWSPQGGGSVWINGFWRAPRYVNSYRVWDRDDHRRFDRDDFRRFDRDDFRRFDRDRDHDRDRDRREFRH